MQTIRLDVSNDVYDKVMFFLENLPKNKVKLQLEQKNNKNISKLATFHKLIEKSNNKKKLTIDIATNTDEMINDGIF